MSMANEIPYLQRTRAVFFAWLLVYLIPGPASVPVHALSAGCTKISIAGEVASGKEWSAPMGRGWILRLLPVQPGDKYTGWDIVVDQSRPAGFPDAVFLATPPYGSLNEREIATTFGLRAQDAIGWNPRTFRFLTDSATFRAARQVYSSSHTAADPKSSGRLPELIRSSSQGELRVLDAGVAPGIADPAPYAQNWALNALRPPHQTLPSP